MPSKMGCRLIFLAAVLVQSPGATAGAQTAGDIYRSHYFLAGLLSRSSTVCGGDWKHTDLIALQLIRNPPELRRITEAYPATTRQWANEGASAFNAEVYANGLASACALAAKTLAEAEIILKSSR
jgi:hypothetical protein